MWIIIEAFGGPEYASIIPDHAGEVLIFDTEDDAKEYAKELQGPCYFVNIE